jgi:hypothetical protein
VAVKIIAAVVVVVVVEVGTLNNIFNSLGNRTYKFVIIISYDFFTMTG